MRKTYILVHFLDHLAEGTRFESSAWPLHLTIAPPFSIELGRADLETVLGFLKRKPPIDSEVTGPAQFGPQHDIPVMELRRTPELQALYEETIAALSRHGAVFKGANHIRAGYRPHITLRKNESVRRGQAVRVDSVTLVDNPLGGAREVLEHFQLDYGTSP